jgi:hypothetical protein
MISHMSPQAAWALKMLGQRTRRRRDRAPFVGKRYFITANLAERAQHIHSNETKVVRLPAGHPRAAVPEVAGGVDKAREGRFGQLSGRV